MSTVSGGNPLRGRGKPARSSPYRGSHPAGGGGGLGLPSRLLRRVRGGGGGGGGSRLAGRRAEALRLCEVAVVAFSAPPRCARFADPGETEIQTAEAAAAAPSPRPRWG
uniref:serine/arginine-rich splicing factor 1-like n=1 Tax=Odobenus rosmarus divergens TaxID=9708 RepID=UPI00063CB415|nr:PREDICTED: serine/arginine-rich splicing factor 1-like [Odobenus rosmarus divergens]